MRALMIFLVIGGCVAATLGISQALHVSPLGEFGIGFVITVIVLNVTRILE